MSRLNRYLLLLVLWLSFFFNIERFDLDVANPGLINIASPIYVAVVVVVTLGLLLSQLKPTRFWQIQLLGALVFVLARTSSERPLWGDVYTYISLFELASVLISAALGYKVGVLCTEFVEAVQSLLYSDMDGRVYRQEQAEVVIKREMQLARRANRPLSIMVLDVDAHVAPLAVQAAEREIQQVLAKRHRMIAVTRLLARSLRRTDFVVDQTEEGRIVLIMPEMQKAHTMSALARLDQRVQRRLGFSLCYGVASFPDQGVTFEELAFQAKSALKPILQERRSDDGRCEAGSITQQLAVMEPATAMQVAGVSEEL